MLPIGSIIEVKNTKAMIVGYINQEIDNKVKVCYSIVPWPVGITSINRIYVVDSDSVKMIAEGYCTNEQTIVLKYFDGLKKLSEKVDADEFEKIMTEAAKRLEDE